MHNIVYKLSDDYEDPRVKISGDKIKTVAEKKTLAEPSCSKPV